MAKRFTDTDKWKQPFIRTRKTAYKLLWMYIWDECDHAGIWQVDFETAQIKIGEAFNTETAMNELGEKILVFDGGEKWLIPGFIEFQYGILNPANKVHLSVINLLKKYSLLDSDNKIKPLASTMHGAKDKDKAKEQDTVLVLIQDQIKEQEPEINIWIEPEHFLKQDEIWWTETILIKNKLPPEELDKCLTQYWLSIQRKNEKGTLQMFRAGFQKWRNTWEDNLKEKNKQNVTNGKTGEHNQKFGRVDAGKLKAFLAGESGNGQ